MSLPTIPLASLRFDGERFANHALDVDCVGELTEYKRLVMACAKELWRRTHREYERLPKNFEERLALQFTEVLPGSAIVNLKRVSMQHQAALEFDDEFDAAARLIDDAIAAAADGALMPVELPRNVIPLFREFGRTLRESETLFVQSRHRAVPAAYNAEARHRLAEWTEATYEDTVDIVGEVSMANVRGGGFELVIASSNTPIRGKFSDQQEGIVLGALQSHSTLRLRVRGTGEFLREDGQLRKLIRIDDVSTAVEPEFVDNVKPIWETVAAIGSSLPDSAWENVPDDLAQRLDHYLYSGNAKR
jgi:hypothetical protein